MCNSALVAPNGQTYNLCDQSGRAQARQDNPAYTFDDSGYLLTGSGGAPSSDPSRGGNGNDGGTGTGRQVMPWIEGGSGTASPGGYTGTPITATQQQQIAQQVQAAANNLIPSGPGGADLLSAVQQFAQGAANTINNAISSASGTTTDGLTTTRSGSHISSTTWLLIGGGVLALLALKPHHR